MNDLKISTRLTILIGILSALLISRLAKRLKHHQLASYGAYFSFITSARGKEELQEAVDSLTTNETHFFREPKHFDSLSIRQSSAHPRCLVAHPLNASHPVPRS